MKSKSSKCEIGQQNRQFRMLLSIHNVISLNLLRWNGFRVQLLHTYIKFYRNMLTKNAAKRHYNHLSIYKHRLSTASCFSVTRHLVPSHSDLCQLSVTPMTAFIATAPTESSTTTENAVHYDEITAYMCIRKTTPRSHTKRSME